MTRSYICDIFFLGDKNMFKKICSSILCFILFWAIFASTFFVSVQQEFSLMNRAKALELENIDITNLDMKKRELLIIQLLCACKEDVAEDKKDILRTRR